MVVRNLAEHVMDLMSPNVMNQVMAPSIVTINGAELSPDIVPLLICIPWQGCFIIVVLQEGDKHNPIGKYNYWQNVVSKQSKK